MIKTTNQFSFKRFVFRRKLLKVKENIRMRFFATKKKLIKTLAEELAYLQIRADWWYYCFNDGKNPDKVIDNDTEITVRDMSSSELDLVTEVKTIAIRFNILPKVYEEAYKIYDFRNSGKKDFVPDIELIKRLDREFCEPLKKRRPVF